MSEYDSKRELSCAGIPVPEQTVVRSTEELRDACRAFGYPLVLKLMKKVRSHIRPWMPAALAVFMAVNMLTSALALARYDARTSGDAPNGQLEVFLDEHFDNARMEHIYPNAKKVTKAE